MQQVVIRTYAVQMDNKHRRQLLWIRGRDAQVRHAMENPVPTTVIVREGILNADPQVRADTPVIKCVLSLPYEPDNYS